MEGNGECFEPSNVTGIARDGVQAFPMVHTHEESPLPRLLLNSCPEVWHMSLERDQMGSGVSNSNIYEVRLVMGSRKVPNS